MRSVYYGVIDPKSYMEDVETYDPFMHVQSALESARNCTSPSCKNTHYILDITEVDGLIMSRCILLKLMKRYNYGN